jgi:hypothetical protein
VSIAVQVTVEQPDGNVDPDGGLQEEVTPGQLSLAIGVAKVITEVDPPGTGITEVTAGQVIIGGTVSLTVMVNEHGSDVLPKESLAMQVTVVSPLGKVEPEGGEQIAEHDAACSAEAERIA